MVSILVLGACQRATSRQVFLLVWIKLLANVFWARKQTVFDLGRYLRHASVYRPVAILVQLRSELLIDREDEIFLLKRDTWVLPHE